MIFILIRFNHVTKITLGSPGIVIVLCLLESSMGAYAAHLFDAVRLVRREAVGSDSVFLR